MHIQHANIVYIYMGQTSWDGTYTVHIQVQYYSMGMQQPSQCYSGIAKSALWHVKVR